MAAFPVVPLFPFPPRQNAQSSGRVQARLTSLDTGVSQVFIVEPSEHDRSYTAEWQQAGVAQASPQFLEYRQSNPEERIYRATLDAYDRPGGVANSIELELGILKYFTRRVPGKKRAHICLYTQGEQRFRCVVTDISVPVKNLNQSGGAMIAVGVSITLREVGS